MRLFFCGSLPSACMRDCSASSLRSALKVLKSVSSAEKAPLVSAAPSALPELPFSKPWPCPELYAISAASNLVLSSVKSRSTRMFVASDTSAIKSAGCIFVSTNFFAALTDRSICSGSIAETSRKSKINRRSRASSDGAAFLAERSSVPGPAAPETIASAAPAVAGLSGLLGKHRRRLQEQPPCCEERKCLSRNPHIHLPSEPEARLHCHAPHAARPCDLPECK